MRELEVWVRPSGNLVVHTGGAMAFSEVSQHIRWVRNWSELPADAVLLVRETERPSAVFDPKSSEALRQAADVIEATSPPFSDFAAYTMRSATDLRTEADRLERETKAQAARAALVEEMARAGYEAVDEVLANGDSSRLRHWDSFTQGKEHHRIIARALLDDPRFKIERVEDE